MQKKTIASVKCVKQTLHLHLLSPLANYLRLFDCSDTITCHLRNIIAIAEKTVDS